MTAESPEAARVLVIEDDADINVELVELLSEHGFPTEAVSDGHAALARLHAPGMALPDVILLDLHMRGMDGWTFRMEQRRDPLLRSIPVIVISSEATAQAQAIDATVFLLKPLDSDRLVREVTRVVADRRRARQAEAEAHRERMAGLGRLAAGVAHEINNPLAWVSANLRTLLSRLPILLDAARPKLLEASQKELLEDLDELVPLVEEAIQGAGRIGEIVSQVRSLSQPDRAQLRPTSVVSALEGAIAVMELKAQGRVTVTRDLQPVSDVVADPAQLHQLFVNLLMNAAQAVTSRDDGAGSGTVRITARQVRGRNEIVITDDGVGIPEGVRRQIFDPFFTTREVGQGSGLGLFLCHGITTALNGDLEVDSIPGRGTTIRVSLPVVRAPPGESSKAAAPGERAAGPRLLIVEDEPVLGRALARLLGRRFEVKLTESVEAAVALLGRDEKVDVILCDVHMPHQGGPELHAVVRERFPHLEPRMVFMSGGALNAQTEAFIDHLAERVLSKPLEHDRLEALLLRLSGIVPPPSGSGGSGSGG